MTPGGTVRWGIVGTANIARAQLLPALRAAGGVPAVVASRELSHAEEFAAAHGVARGVAGYQALIEDPAVDVLYNALPNALHAEWTVRALEAGKPMLCEKPLTGALADTQRVLGVARQTGTLLWEAFVFPFHRQFRQIRELVADGAIGELAEIKSNFHFTISNPANIRLSRVLDGGALNDVGCYPVRLAQELFGPHESAWARAIMGGQDVDLETWGVLGYPGGRRLMLSAGMRRGYDTFTRLEGTSGQIQISNPFHPGRDDSYQVTAAGSSPRIVSADPGEPSFTAAIRHINAVLSGEEEPRMLAINTSLDTARALHDLAQSGISGAG
jgi:predicted dehydrogenase